MFERCLFCEREMTGGWGGNGNHSDGDGHVAIETLSCPFCRRRAVKIVIQNSQQQPISSMIVHPLGAKRHVPKEVPEKYAAEYQEACAVLGVSEKSSAALSRRCLQRLLEEELKVTSRQLADQIDEAAQSLPDALRTSLHIVREIGNFGAHPIKSEHPGEVVDVEPHEASWSLECLSDLFDYVFVKPVEMQTRRDEFNAKLTSIGRKPI